MGNGAAPYSGGTCTKRRTAWSSLVSFIAQQAQSQRPKMSSDLSSPQLIDFFLQELNSIKMKHRLTGEARKIAVPDFIAEAFAQGVGLDVVVSVDGEEVKASKFVLIACSDVFRVIMQNDKQSQSNRVDLSNLDMQFSAVKIVIKWLHSDQLSVIKFGSVQEAIDVYQVADFLQLQDVKDMAVNILVANMCRENVSRLLMFSHLYNVPKLFERCVLTVHCQKWQPLTLPDWADVGDDLELCTKFLNAYDALNKPAQMPPPTSTSS